MFAWVLRAAWAVLPLVAGPGFADSLDSRSGPVQTVASVGLWAVWAAVLLATLVPMPVGLTALRVAAPMAFAWAVFSGDWLAIVSTLVVGALALAPATGMLFVNGGAYPNERRFPLRTPGALMTVMFPTWALAVGPLPAGLLLLAAGRLWGIAVLVVGAGLSFVLLRSLHGLSRRWVVFVPAGIVLHDPMALADPVLFQRQVIESLHLAPADTDSLDLTQAAFGLAVELVLREKVPMTLLRGEQGSSARLLFTPTRPGAVLAEAEERRIRR